MPKTIIVLPTYNEAENLPLMIDALLTLPVDNLNILVVDDNSPDGTGRLADQFAEQHAGRIHVLHRPHKTGLGPAYIAGFKQALSLDADYILQMDCDFSHQPKYIPDMLAFIEKGNDLVVGSRYVRGGSVDEKWSFTRKALSWFANRLYVHILLGIPMTDATGGFRLWRRNTLLGIDLDSIRYNGYIFQVEMAYVACRLGYKVAEIPIHFPDRTLGHSKMNMKISSEAALRVWQLMYRYHALTPQMRRTPQTQVNHDAPGV